MSTRSRSRMAWELALGIVVALTATGAAWAQSGPAQTAGQRPAQPVVVTNSPGEPVPVAVGNLPAVQEVSGTVLVGNVPESQVVSGTVDVGNLPATQVVSGTVDVGNFPPPAPPPLWQGTPYVKTVPLGSDPECVALAEPPAGTVLFVKHLVVTLVENVISMHLTVPGDARQHSFFVPVSADDPTAPFVDRGASLEMGMPVTSLHACANASAQATVLGYLVPAP